MAPLLEVKNLHTEFRTGAGVVRAVDGISYTVEQGETVAIVGESGSGKSVGALSILRLITDPPGRIVRGEVLFAGRDLMQLPDAQMREVRGSDIGMIFQEPMTSLNPVLTIGRQITETLEQHRQADRLAAHQRAMELLGLVGIADPARRTESGVKPPWSASTSVTATGGEKDRGALKASSTRRKARTSSKKTRTLEYSAVD